MVASCQTQPSVARSLLLDTNLLLLYLVTQVDLSLLHNFKRVSNFQASDLQPLRDLVEAFSQVVTTPHVLTEVSNFVDQVPPPWRPQMIQALRSFVLNHLEYFEASEHLVNTPEFSQLGLADVSLLSLSNTATIATLDYKLFHRILNTGGQAIHFDHVRGERTPPRTSKSRGNTNA